MKHYAGYNSYGIDAGGYHAIHAFDSKRERDEWVDSTNARIGENVAEAVSATVAYQEFPYLLTGEYKIEGSLVVGL